MFQCEFLGESWEGARGALDGRDPTLLCVTPNGGFDVVLIFVGQDSQCGTLGLRVGRRRLNPSSCVCVYADLNYTWFSVLLRLRDKMSTCKLCQA